MAAVIWVISYKLGPPEFDRECGGLAPRDLIAGDTGVVGLSVRPVEEALAGQAVSAGCVSRIAQTQEDMLAYPAWNRKAANFIKFDKKASYTWAKETKLERADF